MTPVVAPDVQGVVELALDELFARFPQPAVADPVEFLSAQFDAGLAWAHFQRGCGGLGVSASWNSHISARLRSVGAPLSLGDFVAVHQVAALLHDLELTDRETSLRSIFTGEQHWCQLFSEPAAGSDLAGVAATAISEGREWVVTGQKVWTSGAREADRALLLARTDPQLTKHAGMTMFVVDMAAEGVDVRSLRQADGGARFNEVYLTEVRLDDSQRLGEVGAGWTLALKVLNTERDGASNIFLRPLDELLALWKERDGAAPWLRDDLTRLWIERKVIEWNELRARECVGPGQRRLTAFAKIQASEHAQRLANLASRVAGPAALVDHRYDQVLADDLTNSTSSATKFHTMSLQTFMMRSRAMSIEGGTNEIQRNIVGERVLGLPADIRVDKNRPWNEVRNH